MVIWITGLSGAGKSTLATELTARMRAGGHRPVLLDGDRVREAIADPHVGYDRKSRLDNAMRICRLAALIANQGVPVVVATMSLFREVFEWNRTHLPGYFEVFVDVPIELLKQRDARGLYSRAERGDTGHVVGLHMEYDTPERPDLVVHNHEDVGRFVAVCEDIISRATDG